MTQLLVDIIILALVLRGVSTLFRSGMILEKVDDYLALKINRFWLKPLYRCPACMSSIWGVVWSLYFHYSIEQWIIVTLGACGLNYLLYELIYRE